MSRPTSRPTQNNFIFKPPVNFGSVNDADRLFQQGFALLNQGRHEQAKEILEKAIKINPKHFDALHLLGIIAAQVKNHALAISFFDKAVKLNRTNPFFYFNRGNAYIEANQIDNALINYNKSIDLDPLYAEAYFYKAIALTAKNLLSEALVSINKAIQIKPDHAEYLTNRGGILAKLNLFEEALISYDMAISLNPNHALAFNNRGNVLKNLNQFEDALKSYDKAIEFQHDYADAYSNRGIVLFILKRFDQALRSYDTSIELKCDSAEAYLNRGNALMEFNSFDEALASYDKTIKLKPDYADAYSNRGIALSNLKRYAEALESYDKAIKLKPDLTDSYLNKSLILLLLQDFKNGWQAYEWRWKSKQKKSNRDFVQPLWLGVESLLNQTILIHAEQGLGDTIQFCRYAALVKKLGARVLLEVPKSLMVLLKDLEGVDILLEQGKPLPDFDFHCPLLSLPLAFKTELQTIPFPKSYLKADQNKINQWQKRLNLNGFKVGLVWSGGFRAIETESSSIFERRNIPLKILAQKLNSIKVNYFSLQKGDPAESEIRGHETEYWPSGNFFNYADELLDFSDTAALISNMDLVIAVDTSTAHLAGALGKPTWILNRFDLCWRWMLDRDDSPWYESVKLYRQEDDRQWAPVLERVARDLKELNTSFSS